VVLMLQESLSEFVARLRAKEDWSREVGGRGPRRAGLEISASYVAKIERCEIEPGAISVEKLDALAAGLQQTRGDLLRFIPDPAGSPVEEEVAIWPPDDIERAIIRAMGLDNEGPYRLSLDNPLWQERPEERSNTIRNREDLWREEQLAKKKRAGA
jgi:transcriptional regulator with XRE-family HTH domain